MSADASHRSLKLTSVLLLAVWAATTLCWAKDPIPGVITIHNETFVKVMHEDILTGDWLKEKLNKTLIPDQEGELLTVLWSKLYYKLSDIVLINYTTPKVDVSITSNENITLNIVVLKITLNCKHNIELKTGNWTLSKVSGDVLMIIIGANVTMSRQVVITEENKEKVKYISHNCTAVVKDVYLVINDSLAKNISGRIDNKNLKEEVEDRLCNASMYLTEYDFSFENDHMKDFYLDMAIIKDPIILNSSLVFHHRGEVRPKNDTTPYTSWPEETILPLDSDSMVTYGISNWTLNTLCKVIHNNKLFNYTYNEDDLTEDLKYLLHTTCEKDDCFGKHFPNVSSTYPNQKVELFMSTFEVPVIEIGPERFILSMYFNMKAFVITSDSKEEKMLFSVNFVLSTHVVSSVNKDKVVFELTRPGNTTFTVLSSSIGYLHEENLRACAALAVQKKVLPFVLMLKTEGFKMNSLSNFTITDSKLVMTSDVLWYKVNVVK